VLRIPSTRGRSRDGCSGYPPPISPEYPGLAREAAYRRGVSARRQGLPIADNPHRPEHVALRTVATDALAWAWELGWATEDRRG
jgi:hypothetical protein